jgi:hypothetical protein
VTTSVSPPPGPASGLVPIGLTMLNWSPPSVERWTNDCWVEIPQGPDSQ